MLVSEVMAASPSRLPKHFPIFALIALGLFFAPLWFFGNPFSAGCDLGFDTQLGREFLLFFAAKAPGTQISPTKGVPESGPKVKKRVLWREGTIAFSHLIFEVSLPQPGRAYLLLRRDRGVWSVVKGRYQSTDGELRFEVPDWAGWVDEFHGFKG